MKRYLAILLLLAAGPALAYDDYDDDLDLDELPVRIAPTRSGQHGYTLERSGNGYYMRPDRSDQGGGYMIDRDASGYRVMPDRLDGRSEYRIERRRR